MKKIGRIMGSALVGIISAVIAFTILILGDFFLSAKSGKFGPPHAIDAISIGGDYAIGLKATPIHPYLAEYDQVIELYSVGRDDGKFLDEIEIATNTGGRVRIGIFIPRSGELNRVVLLQRNRMTEIDLATKQTTYSYAEGGRPFGNIDDELKFLGWVSGVTSPLKFVPCSVWETLSNKYKEDIVGDDKKLLDLCEDFS